MRKQTKFFWHLLCVQIFFDISLFESIYLELYFFLKEVLLDSGVEELLMGMASQISEREDAVLCSDVRGNRIFIILR